MNTTCRQFITTWRTPLIIYETQARHVKVLVGTYHKNMEQEWTSSNLLLLRFTVVLTSYCHYYKLYFLYRNNHSGCEEKCALE